MATLTKKAIRDAFLTLLDEHPLSKITVKDITDACGMTRNTFYYHYDDIPSLIEEIFITEIDRIIKAYPSLDSVDECLRVAMGFAMEHKKALLHIYKSANRDIYEHYLWEICSYTVTTYIDTAFADEPMSAEDKDTVIHYIKCACFGMVIDWMNCGMNDSTRKKLLRICELKKGMAAELIRRSARN